MRERDPSTTPTPERVGAAGRKRRLDFGPGGVRLWGETLRQTGWTRLALAFEREMEAGRGFLWLPVLSGIGIIIYFVLPREPWAPALAGLAFVLTVVARRVRHRAAPFRLAVAAVALICGVTAAKLRTDWVAAPRIDRERTVTATGWIAAREEAGHGATRFRLRVASIDGLDAEATPPTVRFTARGKGVDRLGVGDGVTALVRLQPPSGPVMPGGYDFARAAFYDGIGAVGFSYGAPKPAAIGPPPLGVALARPLARLRDVIRRRLEATLPGDEGHLAAALIVGDQRGISQTTQDAMRASGLGHVLAISGLHMALIAGSAFWLIRALLALSPLLALTRPIKKWAAAGGLVVATFYLGISGASIATQRAFVMLAIMLFAILLDRRAITLRNVALGALVVLAITPESLLSAGFQMSFAATVALVVGYEAVVGRVERRRLLADTGDRGVLARLRHGAASLLLTSLIAGLATTPFAAYHFQRIAPLSLLANLAAMPVFSLLVMPMALAAMLLMPFGLETLPLTPMKWGLDWVVAVADKAAAWSAGAGAVPMMPAAAILLMVAGFLWLALWRERWRFAGIAPMAAGIALALLAVRPDILVNEKGTAVAVRGADGGYHVVAGRGTRFEVGNWLRADADMRAADDPSLADGTACDPIGCVARLGGEGTLVALVRKPDAFAEDCRLAAVVVSRHSAPRGCAAEALVIDRTALARHGAHALYRDTGRGDVAGRPAFTVETAYPDIRRPFMPPVPDQ